MCKEKESGFDHEQQSEEVFVEGPELSVVSYGGFNVPFRFDEKH
jgi:hypothetical protein